MDQCGGNFGCNEEVCHGSGNNVNGHRTCGGQRGRELGCGEVITIVRVTPKRINMLAISVVISKFVMIVEIILVDIGLVVGRCGCSTHHGFGGLEAGESSGSFGGGKGVCHSNEKDLGGHCPNDGTSDHNFGGGYSGRASSWDSNKVGDHGFGSGYGGRVGSWDSNIGGDHGFGHGYGRAGCWDSNNEGDNGSGRGYGGRVSSWDSNIKGDHGFGRGYGRAGCWDSNRGGRRGTRNGCGYDRGQGRGPYNDMTDNSNKDIEFSPNSSDWGFKKGI